MKVLINLLKTTNVIMFLLLSSNIFAQSEFQTYSKSNVPFVNNKLGKEFIVSPYSTNELDYHLFKREGEDPWSATQGDWYLRYKAMFDFRYKEPFFAGGPVYTKKDYLKGSYKFILIDNQIIEDSLAILLDKYLLNNKDTLKKWNLPANNDVNKMQKIINRLGVEHFDFVLTVFNLDQNAHYIDVPEAEQTDDEMVALRLFKYPADVDIFLFNFTINNWKYIESVTVSGDHELELYVLQKFEPRYLENCNELE
jgi:hypothetical protein